MDNIVLPVKSIVLFIGFGAVLFILAFIFAKRQITRFALRSSRYIPIGNDAPKSMRREIEKRLHRVSEIMYEPQLLSQATEQTIYNTFKGETCHFLYRMKAVDAIKQLDAGLHSYNADIKRFQNQSLRLFLHEQSQKGSLHNAKMDVIHRFTALYEHARHDPADFTEEHYDEYMGLLNHLINHIRNNKNAQMSSLQDRQKHSTNLLPKMDVKPDILSGVSMRSTESSGQKDRSPPESTSPAADPVQVQVVYRPGRSGQEASAGAMLLAPRCSTSSVSSTGSILSFGADSQRDKATAL